MGKQEKIREGLAKRLYHQHADGHFETASRGIKNNYYLDADMALRYLHSQGLVIKVEKELPASPIKITTDLELGEEEAKTRQAYSDLLTGLVQRQMTEAGFAAFEPLIEEGK